MDPSQLVYAVVILTGLVALLRIERSQRQSFQELWAEARVPVPVEPRNH